MIQQATVPVIAELVVLRVTPSLYEYVVQVGSEVLVAEAGFASVAGALSDAAEQAAGLIGLEVSYTGIVVGTYSPAQISQDCEAVANLCVENAQRFVNQETA